MNLRMRPRGWVWSMKLFLRALLSVQEKLSRFPLQSYVHILHVVHMYVVL